MAKDTPRITAGELHKIVEAQGQKKKKKKENTSNSTYTTCCLGGFQEKKREKKSRKENALFQTQSSEYSVVRHVWNFKRDWLLWSDVTTKLAF